METENLIKHAREYGEEVESGLIWETRRLPDRVVQMPRAGEEWRVDKTLFLYDELSEEVNMPEILDFQAGEKPYIAFERLDERTVEDVKNEDVGDSPVGEKYIEVLEKSGEELAKFHRSEGLQYGSPDWNGWTEEGSHSNWREFVQDKKNYILEVTENSPFESPVQGAAENLQIDAIPENPGSSILHNDYGHGNILVDDGEVNVIDLDNAIYGDNRFGYIRSLNMVLDDDLEDESRKDAENAFRRGYEKVESIDMEKDLEDSYNALAILFSAEGGEWVDRNKDEDYIEAWAENLESRKERYFQ